MSIASNGRNHVFVSVITVASGVLCLGLLMTVIGPKTSAQISPVVNQNSNSEYSFFPAPVSIGTSPTIPIVSGPNSLTPTLPPESLTSVLQESDELHVSFLSVNFGAPGDSITLSGSGFSLQSNTLIFKGESRSFEVKNISAKSSSEIVFAVPSDLLPGRYDLSVSNSFARTQKTSPESVPFMVTARNSALPVIEKIEPAVATFGQAIMITGRNFTPTGNILTSSVGIFEDLKSEDGRTISFTIPVPEYLKNNNSQLRKVWFGDKDNLYWSVRAQIANINGVSEAPQTAQFIINI